MKFYVYLLFACFSAQSALQAAHAKSNNEYFLDGIQSGMVSLTQLSVDNPEIDVNYQNKDKYWGRTPLMLAVLNGNSGFLIPKLLKRGANPNIQDNAGRTALWHLASISDGPTREKQFNVELAQALLKSGANPNIPDNTGMTPLMRAASQDDPYFVIFLLQNGADINATTKTGMTVFDSAFTHPKIEAVLKRYAAAHTPQQEKLRRDAYQKVISGTGPLTAQQTASQSIQEFLG